MTDLLERILGPEPPPFALVYRPESGPGELEVMLGDLTEHGSLAEIPLSAPAGPDARDDVLVVVPYRQIAERGFAAPDDGTPLLAMTISERDAVPLGDALARLPDVPVALTDGHFDLDDAEYAEVVRKIIADEIGNGVGANFVVKRSFAGRISDYRPQRALSVFRRLLERERQTHWTFIIHTGETTLVGATPERHVSLSRGTAVMNPISGTYRYPPGGQDLQGIMDFLADGKEADELYMVLDEGLKMMARICEGVRISGPFLKEMAWLAHTGYQIEGSTRRDVRKILRETMFAATVTGSPLESAASVIRRYEPEGRGYYSGVAALIGHDELGERTLDSAILIRTAEIDRAGRVRTSAGATLVRHSDPRAEAAETRAKLAALLNALGYDKQPACYAGHPAVRAALGRRNADIADFWRDLPDPGGSDAGGLEGLSAVIVDAEDTFTAMLEKQLRSLGLSVTVSRFDEQHDVDGDDLLVLGPGPGDPCEVSDPKIAYLRSVIGNALRTQRPMLTLCLSHQILSSELGLDVRRREVPNQGVQRVIDLFGARARVGFYNTFAAYSPTSTRMLASGVVEVSRDEDTGEVHALRGPHFLSMQFHPESVLTVDGPRILRDAIRGVLAASPVRQLARLASSEAVTAN